MSNRNSISYRCVGDYLIPNLIIPPEEASIRIGKFGVMRMDYLEKHKKVLLTRFLLNVSFTGTVPRWRNRHGSPLSGLFSFYNYEFALLLFCSIISA